MTTKKTTFRIVGAMAVLVLALALPATERATEAHGHMKSLVGTWYADIQTPAGRITGFSTNHQDGTTTVVRSVDKGGPPQVVAGQTHSTGLGIWRPAWHKAKAKGVFYFFSYAIDTGAAMSITGVRYKVGLDRHDFDSASGEFWVSIWFCDELPDNSCPDPTVVDPDIPESPDSLPWTMRRIRLR